MTDSRAKRQKAISDMIRADPVGSQDEVTERLKTLGYAVTQATVSRDLEQMGAVKVKRGGALSYVLPDQLADNDWAATRLQRIFTEWVQSVEAAGNLIVVRTPPGSAHLVCIAIDQAKLPEVAGTVSGDDTLFVAIHDGVTVEAVASRFRALSGEG